MVDQGVYLSFKMLYAKGILCARRIYSECLGHFLVQSHQCPEPGTMCPHDMVGFHCFEIGNSALNQLSLRVALPGLLLRRHCRRVVVYD